MTHHGWFTPTHHAQTREAIRLALVDALPQYLPPGPYREFYGWALSEANPYSASFVRAIALDQLGTLTGALLGDLVGPDDWPTLLEYALPVNLYQIFEVVSDNLALGIFGKPTAGAADRRDVLLRFNDAIVDELEAPTAAPAATVLAQSRAPAAKVSAFRQSLAARLHDRVACRYVESTGLASEDELEHSVWPGLVANLESGRRVLDRIAGTRTEPLVRQGTADRYRGVSRILRAGQLSRLERAVVGSHTIMVVPTLGYFTAVLGEITASGPGYTRAVGDGSLLEVLADAALLVRLQNDIGTGLLSLPGAARARKLKKLPNRFPAPNPGQDGMTDLLLRASEREPALNRFRKDLRSGEYNICLTELYDAVDVEEGVEALIDSVGYYASLYRRHRALFVANLQRLDARLDDDRICALIRRFVEFHERMYAHPFDDGEGDYAV